MKFPGTKIYFITALIFPFCSGFALEVSPNEFLFVVGGETPLIPDNTIEVVSFNQSLNPVPECLKDIANYPEDGLQGSTGTRVNWHVWVFDLCSESRRNLVFYRSTLNN